MIPFFPEPLPDELLYSVCARYSDRVQYPHSKILMQELFEKYWAKATYDFPTGLNHLIAVLPPGHGYTTFELINNHTMLPFYSPFCPLLRVKRVREEMLQDNKVPIPALLGILYHRRQNWLRFCPICAENDFKQYGEPYWHRLHQASGVEVCPIHAVFLEESSACVGRYAKSYDFISAQRAIQPKPPRLLNNSDPNHQAMIKIAFDAAWLLSQGNLVSNMEILHKRYKKLLIEKGLANYQGTVSRRKLLVETFLNFYSADLLEILHCPLDSSSSHNNWLVILKELRVDNIRPTIHHLLFIQFLGYTVEEFFQLPYEIKPFESGPWPCLNPVCKFFQQPQIKECLMSHSLEPSRRPIGTFQCTCGFCYSRLGPDKSAEDRFRYSRVELYGWLWETELRKLWSDPQISVQKIAQRLQVDHGTVKRQAAWLGLEFPRVAKKTTLLDASIAVPKRNSQTKQDKLESYRQQWLSTIQENPDAQWHELKQKCLQAYYWLSKHDSDWLAEHKPKSKKLPTPRQTDFVVDWATRDAQWATEVLIEAQRIGSTPGCPIRITRAELGRNIGHLTKMNGNLDKLPLTSIALAKVVETREEFAIRRVWWAVEYFRSLDLRPTHNQLVRRSGTGWKTASGRMADRPLVKQAIDAALQSIQ